MIANGAFLASLLLFVVVVFVGQELTFLAPYRGLLLSQYAVVIAAALGVVYVNLFAGCYLVARRLWLTDTGRKLAHVEKQLQTGDTIVRDLSARLAAEE